MLIPFAHSAQCSLDRFEHMYLSKQASKRLYNIYVLAHPIHSGAGRTIFAPDEATKVTSERKHIGAQYSWLVLTK